MYVCTVMHNHVLLQLTVPVTPILTITLVCYNQWMFSLLFTPYYIMLTYFLICLDLRWKIYFAIKFSFILFLSFVMFWVKMLQYWSPNAVIGVAFELLIHHFGMKSINTYLFIFTGGLKLRQEPGSFDNFSALAA